MAGTSPWQPIESAPKDGAPCLLLDRTLERNTYMPGDRRVHNAFAVVGRWHVPGERAAKSDWVTDIRAIDFEGDQPFWEACLVEPTHWMPLPNAPPGEPWIAADTLPIAYEYVLLHVPNLNRLREHPMAEGEQLSSSFDMVIGCRVDNVQTTANAWLTDLSETHQIDNDPEDLGVGPVSVSPAYWMVLPSPPDDGA